jgi:hypothetical protein
MFCLPWPIAEHTLKLGIESDIHTHLFPYLLYPMNAISMMGSIYMTMAVGLERFIALQTYRVQNGD